MQAEEKRNMKPKEAMKLLIDELFALVDGDNDGKLTKDELTILPAHAGLEWSADEQTKAVLEILGLKGSACNQKKFTEWLESDSDMSNRLIGESPKAITYRMAICAFYTAFSLFSHCFMLYLLLKMMNYILHGNSAGEETEGTERWEDGGNFRGKAGHGQDKGSDLQ